MGFLHTIQRIFGVCIPLNFQRITRLSHIVSDRIGIVGRKHSDMIFQKIDDDLSGEIDFGEFLGIIKKNSDDELCIMIDMRAK